MRATAIGLVLTGMLGGVPAMASDVREIPVERQARDSDLIVVATYDGVQATTIDPATRLPYKDQVVWVKSCPKMATSTCPKTITVRALGGEVPAYDRDGTEITGPDGRTVMLEVPDNEAMPSLQPGEYVLFLSRQGVPDGKLRLYGARKGMRPVVETGGVKTVTLPFDDWGLLSESGRTAKTNLALKRHREKGTGGAYYTDTVPLTQLRSLIDRVSERSRTTPPGK